MFFTLSRIPLLGLILFTSAAMAMEKPFPQEAVQKPVLPEDLSSQQIQELEETISSYNVLMLSYLESGHVQQLYDQMFVFVDQIDKAVKYANQYMHYLQMRDQYISAETALSELSNELSKLAILKGATNYHIAMLAAENPVIKHWLNAEIAKSQPWSKKMATEPEWFIKSGNPYEIMPLFLAKLLGLDDIYKKLKRKDFTIKHSNMPLFNRTVATKMKEYRKSSKKK